MSDDERAAMAEGAEREYKAYLESHPALPNGMPPQAPLTPEEWEALSDAEREARDSAFMAWAEERHRLLEARMGKRERTAHQWVRRANRHVAALPPARADAFARRYLFHGNVVQAHRLYKADARRLCRPHVARTAPRPRARRARTGPRETRAGPGEKPPDQPPQLDRQESARRLSDRRRALDALAGRPA